MSTLLHCPSNHHQFFPFFCVLLKTILFEMLVTSTFLMLLTSFKSPRWLLPWGVDQEDRRNQVRNLVRNLVRTRDRRWKSEDKRQKVKDWGQETEGERVRTRDRRWKTEDKIQKVKEWGQETEGERVRTRDRRWKSEDKRQKVKEWGQQAGWWRIGVFFRHYFINHRYFQISSWIPIHNKQHSTVLKVQTNIFFFYNFK